MVRNVNLNACKHHCACISHSHLYVADKKGTAKHKALGRIYMVLMLFTWLVSLFMSAQIGPRVCDHFG